MGDFNARPDSGPMKKLRAAFLDVFANVNPGNPGFTSSPTKLVQRIDYVLFARDKGGRGLASYTLDGPGPQRGALHGHRSDHLGVSAVVELEVR